MTSKKLLACIVETRDFPNIAEIINQHMKFLPDETPLLIFCCNRNMYELKKHFPLIQLFNLDEVFTAVNNERDYNLLLTTEAFWYLLKEYDRVLIFQADSVLFRPGIEEFLEWDYVGAPWKFQHHGGNGGLSLRNPAVMKKICNENEWGPHLGNEDVFFSNLLNSKTEYGKLAPREICERFSVESIFKLGTLGGHAYSKHLPALESNQITYQYK